MDEATRRRATPLEQVFATCGATCKADGTVAWTNHATGEARGGAPDWAAYWWGQRFQPRWAGRDLVEDLAGFGRGAPAACAETGHAARQPAPPTLPCVSPFVAQATPWVHGHHSRQRAFPASVVAQEPAQRQLLAERRTGKGHTLFVSRDEQRQPIRDTAHGSRDDLQPYYGVYGHPGRFILRGNGRVAGFVNSPIHADATGDRLAARLGDTLGLAACERPSAKNGNGDLQARRAAAGVGRAGEPSQAAMMR